MCSVDSLLHAHKISVLVGGGATYAVKIKPSLPGSDTVRYPFATTVDDEKPLYHSHPFTGKSVKRNFRLKIIKQY